MLKRGICRLSDLPPESARGSSAGFLAKRRFVAVSLYPLIAESDRTDRDALLERVLARFPTRNATLKRTQSRRFEAFDAALADLLRQRLTPGKTWRVHDAAVSDGRTAADFFSLLDGIPGLHFEMLASDYAPDARVVSEVSGRLEVVLDPVDGTILQVVWPPFVFNVQQGESPLFYPLNHVIRIGLLRTRVPGLLRRHAQADGSTRERHVWLLHPRCLALREHEPRFRFERLDLLQPISGRFELVRVMNVLNRSYFGASDLQRAIAHLLASLEPGGLLVTGSNEDAGSPVQGGIYERVGDRLERRLASGEGSGVDDLLLAARVPEAISR